MLRKALIGLLTLAAVAMLVVYVASFRARSSRFETDWLVKTDSFFGTSRDGLEARLPPLPVL